MYRHVATAFARKYIQYLPKAVESLSALADKQAGRNQKTSIRHYAVEKESTRDPMKAVRDFEMISVYWHEMVGMETYPPKPAKGKMKSTQTLRKLLSVVASCI